MTFKQIPVKHDFSENVDYILPQYPVYIRKGILSSYQNYRAISHWHEDLEFIYVLSGEMNYEVNGCIVTLHPEEGIVINSRNFHYGFSPEHKECEFLCILIHPSLFSSNTYIRDKYVLPFIECTSIPFLLLGMEDWHRSLAEKLQQMYALETTKEDFFLRCQDLIFSIFSLLYKNTKKSLQKEHSNSPQALISLRQMVHYIQNHYGESLTLADIARVGHMSKTSCCTVFNRYMHTTPVDYLLTYRMSQGYQLLLESDLSITEISYTVGFHDSSYFTKYFRNYYGKTPREVRRKMLEKPENHRK